MLPLRDNVPTRHFPVVTVGLILVNVGVWLLYQLPDLEGSVRQSAFFPCDVDASCDAPSWPWPLTALTAMFLHGSWEHIAGNMLFLWIFGNNVEDAMGRLRYLLFYLLAGTAATATQAFVTLAFGSAADAQIPNVGASGAIAGVMGAYLVLLPHARVLTWFVFVLREIPAGLYLLFWFVFQLWVGSFSLVHPEQGGGVAFFAHVGGFVFGMLMVKLFARAAGARAGLLR